MGDPRSAAVDAPFKNSPFEDGRIDQLGHEVASRDLVEPQSISHGRSDQLPHRGNGHRERRRFLGKQVVGPEARARREHDGPRERRRTPENLRHRHRFPTFGVLATRQPFAIGPIVDAVECTPTVSSLNAILVDFSLPLVATVVAPEGDRPPRMVASFATSVTLPTGSGVLLLSRGIL